MKALTLHQPYASLVALGVKTIETRSWPCPPSLIGQPLAIHAGARRPRTYWHHNVNSDLPPVYDLYSTTSLFEWYEHPDDFMSGGAYVWRGPLGAVVATCRVSACVPIIDDGAPDPGHDVDHLCGEGLYVGDEEFDAADQEPYGDFTPGRYAWLLEDVKPTTERCPACWGSGCVEVPWLDGPRFVCSVCDDAGHCPPVPARGRQRVWNWEPT